ncbi:MAG: AAA family ATPase [Candidatus Nitrosocosmicus sp.]|nr:AAA family ATPase [Candidatus Nitrosocosmicus sp.]MDN5868443.1 AAA family ATPase [Candidatus Nitrosocosmicus sp.]
MKIILTGTPGVGKHTIATILSSLFDKAPIVDINKIILSENLLISSQIGNHDVDIQKSFDFLTLLLSKKEYQDGIIVGHLAPYVIDPLLVDLAVILRRSPYELRKIYEDRSYSQTKISDNMVSEILGIISYDASKNFEFSKLSELEIATSVLPSVSAQKIVNMHGDKKQRSFGNIDWLPLIQNDPDMLKFLK